MQPLPCRAQFQYMLLLRGATGPGVTLSILHGVSIHAPLARSNSNGFEYCAFMVLFQYMLLLRGATDTAARPPHANTFQYMLLLRGATLTPREFAVYKLVSIHAPLARCNLVRVWVVRSRSFQYMLLLRGATPAILADCLALRFNTCSSCEVQPGQIAQKERSLCFNTCSSCEVQHDSAADGPVNHRFNTCSSCEVQQVDTGSLSSEERFNTCSSCEVQRRLFPRGCELDYVSIHAPLARSTGPFSPPHFSTLFQYMLLLRGATRTPRFSTKRTFPFQYMLLLRGATRAGMLAYAYAKGFNTCSSCEVQLFRTRF